MSSSRVSIDVSGEVPGDSEGSTPVSHTTPTPVHFHVYDLADMGDPAEVEDAERYVFDTKADAQKFAVKAAASLRRAGYTVTGNARDGYEAIRERGGYAFREVYVSGCDNRAHTV
jgi:hypothetical protein